MIKKSVGWRWSVLGSVVVAACGGAAMDGVGEMMRDAGETLVDAGNAMADAGAHAMAQAGAGGAGAGGASGTGGDDGSGNGGPTPAEDDGVPRPHWVLRDKDGEPVQAHVGGPGWSTTAAVSKSRFTNAHGDCVWISQMGQREIGLAYSLATGKLDNCGSKPAASWREASSTTYLIGFATSACDGDGYSLTGGDHVQRIGSTHNYVDGAPTRMTTYYVWNGISCEEKTLAAGRDLWAFKQIPADVQNLLPAAPYSLELAY